MKIILLATFLSTLLFGCAGAHQKLNPRNEFDALQPHPLLERVVGPGAVGESLRESSCREKFIEDETNSKEAAKIACHKPLMIPPQFSLSLSGGGYRAALFHYGAIKRLNDMGLLRNVRMVCGVSGGSITGAALVARWGKLNWNADGVASNLFEVVGMPLDSLTSSTIDVQIALKNITPMGSKSVAPDLDTLIFQGQRMNELPDSPDAPLLILGTVNFETGSGWIMSRNYFGSGLLQTRRPNLTIAQAVAASAAFPPFLGPIRFDLPAGTWPKFDLSSIEARTPSQIVAKTLLAGAKEESDFLGSRIYLMDGGVIDNNALGYCARAEIQYVSSAARATERIHISSSWLTIVSRATDLILTSAMNARFSQVCSRPGSVCWRLDDLPAPDRFHLTKEEVNRLEIAQHQPTRFQAMDTKSKCAIVLAGYMSAAAGFSNRPNGKPGNEVLRERVPSCEFVADRERSINTKGYTRIESERP